MALARVWACGPDFPNWLLAEGDQAVLVAPEGNFAAELARMNLGQVRIQAIPPASRDGYAAQSLEAELADLRRALKQAGVSADQAALICRDHAHQRELLGAAIEAVQSWNDLRARSTESSNDGTGSPSATAPVFPNLMVVEGLPEEFADYFEGLIAWHNPSIVDKQSARAAWERLLGRPDAQRHFKSTWAAFMLGKSWEQDDPDKALNCFRQVRYLARNGFRDSVGLAAASLGLEARIYLKQRKYEAAIETYLEQLASGDPTATNSLATTAAKALASGPESLRLLAKNPRMRKVLTAYVISRPLNSIVYPSNTGTQEAEAGKKEPATSAWLEAVEQADVRDVDSAEALARRLTARTT